MPNGGASTAAVRRQDRRRCVRRKILANGEMIPVDLGPMESGLLLDVSARGASVQGLKPLRPGVRISLKFRLPESESSVQPTYEVIWADHNGRIGLKFLYIAEREQRLLDQWAASYFPRPEPEHALEAPEHSKPDAPAPMTLAEELARVVEQAAGYTSAEGGAIALRDELGVVCRASWGNAPEIGVELNPESGLSGECIRTGAAVHCADALNDARVDPVAARELSLRSALIVPIKLDDAVQGLIEVLSSRPDAFTPAHLKSLERLAEIVGFLTGPPVASSIDQPTKAAEASPSEPTHVASSAEPKVALVTETRAIEPAPQPAPAPASSDAVPAVDGPGMAATDAAGIIQLIEPELNPAPPGVQQQSDAPTETATPQMEPAPDEAGNPAGLSLGAVPLSSFENEPRHELRVSVFAAVAVFCGLLLGAVWFLGPRWVSRGDPHPAAPAVTHPAPRVSESPARTPVAQTQEVESDSTPVRVPPQTMFERLISRPDPEYPQGARTQGVDGVVTVDVIIGADGRVERAAPVSGPPALAAAAAKAVRQWRYRPYAKGGKPLRVETVVTVQFPHS